MSNTEIKSFIIQFKVYNGKTIKNGLQFIQLGLKDDIKQDMERRMMYCSLSS